MAHPSIIKISFLSSISSSYCRGISSFKSPKITNPKYCCCMNKAIPIHFTYVGHLISIFWSVIFHNSLLKVILSKDPFCDNKKSFPPKAGCHRAPVIQTVSSLTDPYH